MTAKRSSQPHPPTNAAFGPYLLLLRDRARLTQAELATRIGVHRRSVQKWEIGETYPSAENLRTLVALLIDLGALTPGQERQEASALWQSASQDDPSRRTAFDPTWLDQLLASRAGAPGQPSASAAFPLVDQRRAPSGRPTPNLPFQPTPFIGRAAELRAIARLLADPTCRLLTLLGPGGIGKTRLALEAVAGQTAAFRDGVAFVALASVGTPNQIVPAIGEALNLAFAGQSDPAAHLLAHLRTHQLLLLLDNFEHLLDGADLLSAILDHASQVTLLITSRERLNLRAEWLFTVEGLSYPPADPASRSTAASPTDLTGYSAVQLFVQRVTQIQSGLPPPEATLPTIARICQQVAGMPLAIELAAAGVRMMPIPEIERQIGANLDALATSLRDVPPRHRSLRAVFDHSWQLLNDLERILFCRLAVFRGGCTAAAAEQVAGATLPVLTALIDKSLLRATSAVTQISAGHPHSGPCSNTMSEPRFGLLEPNREYALEKLALRGEVDLLQQAHAAYYLALAEKALVQWDTPTVDAAINLLEREHDNLRAALQWAHAGGAHLIGLQIAGALWRFWRGSGAINEGRAWLEQLLARDVDPPDTLAMTARLRALHGAAWLASDQHDFTRATQLFEQSIMLRRTLRASEGETNLLLNAARQARAAGEYARATSLLEDALSRHRALGDRGSSGSAGLGLSLYELALVQRETGNFARAAALYDECLNHHREIGDQEGLTAARLGLGDVARDQGDRSGLRKHSEESLAFFRELGIQWAIGFALNNLALAAYLADDLPQALALVSESVAQFRALQDDGGLAETLVTLGQILRAQGDGAAAYAALGEALQLAQRVGPQLVVAAALEGLAGVLAHPAAHHQEATQATRLLATAAELRARMGAPVRPLDRPEVERALATARALLGAERFAAIWAEATERRFE